MGQTPPSAEEGGPGGRSRDWLWKVVVPVFVAVVGALLVGALTPIGDGLRELLFPTRAAVSGSVVLRGQPAADAILTLDGEDVGNVDESGAFLLPGVGAGTHRLHLQSVGAQPREIPFFVARETPELDLGVIELKPLVELGYVANWSFQFSGVPYDFTLWMIGDPDVLNRIKSVSYTLPAPLSGPPVTRQSPRKAFCYRETGVLPIEELGGVGPFAVATARVDLGNGQSFEVSALSLFGGALSVPSGCPEKQAAQNGQPSPPFPPPSPLPTTTTPPPATVVVPNVVCDDRDQAEQEIESRGLNMVEVEGVPSMQCPEGTIARQNPEGGVEVEPGSTVQVWESLGPEQS